MSNALLGFVIIVVVAVSLFVLAHLLLHKLLEKNSLRITALLSKPLLNWVYPTKSC